MLQTKQLVGYATFIQVGNCLIDAFTIVLYYEITIFLINLWILDFVAEFNRQTFPGHQS